MARETPKNEFIQPLLTDLYQITMAYAYWKSERHNQTAVFELFFRNNPFNGEYTVFAGLSDCINFISNFAYKQSDIDYIRSVLPSSTEEEFFDFLSGLSGDQVAIKAIPEGSVVFPRVPLITVEGPLATVQLLETTLLTLVNYASLVTTNATRYRLAAGNDIKLLEFGLRRAQGPDGAMSASKYCYIGGFDATSNVLAGKLFSIPVAGTHSHAYIMSFSGLKDLSLTQLHQSCCDNKLFDLKFSAQKWQSTISSILQIVQEEIVEGELAAFIAYAIAFPSNFLALVDTYNVIRSGIPNFCTVTLALDEAGYRAKGIRLDSGDLASLSMQCRRQFQLLADRLGKPWLASLTIVASNDINMDTINSFNQQGHEINAFGIGTHLVTCQQQPSLGCVYKLVELNGTSRMKLSHDTCKITIPANKKIYRLFGKNGTPLMDLLQKQDEPPPLKNQRILCRHPFEESKRFYVLPTKVEELMQSYWIKGQISNRLPLLADIRNYCKGQIDSFGLDCKASTGQLHYKVFVSDALYGAIHTLWLISSPIEELS